MKSPSQKYQPMDESTLDIPTGFPSHCQSLHQNFKQCHDTAMSSKTNSPFLVCFEKNFISQKCLKDFKRTRKDEEILLKFREEVMNQKRLK